MAEQSATKTPPLVKILGSPGSAIAYAIRDFLYRSDVPFEWVQLTTDEEARSQAGLEHCQDSRLPVCIFPDGTRMECPDIRQITDSSYGNTDASWSADGQWIVYSTDHGGLEHPSIFIVSVTGSEPIRVTNDPDHEDGAPSWSPDGQWIYFESHTTTDEESRSGIWRIAVPESVSR